MVVTPHDIYESMKQRWYEDESLTLENILNFDEMVAINNLQGRMKKAIHHGWDLSMRCSTLK